MSVGEAPPYALSEPELLAQCQSQAVLGSGKGGQHRNRTASAVRLVHRSSGIEVRCEEHREHRRNLVAAVTRLRIRLAIAQRGSSVREWLSEYRRKGALSHNPSSDSYPKLVACLLDALDQCHGSLSEAALSLGVSSSQMAKILTADKEVHRATNLLRTQHGCGNIHG